MPNEQMRMRKSAISMALTRAKRNKQIAYQQMKDLHRMATELLRQRGEQFLAAGAVEHHVVQGVMRKKYVTVAKATKVSFFSSELCHDTS